MIYLFLIFLFFFNFTQAHDLQYTVKKINDVIEVSFYFPDGSKFSYESFEIYKEGDGVPFQTGRTDKNGRVIFIPDKEGLWIVKVYSEDGHGSIVKVDVNQASGVSLEKPLFVRYEKAFVGAGLILGIFGIVSIFRCRRIR